MAPVAPSVPTFPTLKWSYEDGKYCIGEEEADKLLDYGENELPLFRQRYDQFLRHIHLILEAVAEPWGN
jgi:hypothetical protein